MLARADEACRENHDGPPHERDLCLMHEIEAAQREAAQDAEERLTKEYAAALCPVCRGRDRDTPWFEEVTLIDAAYYHAQRFPDEGYKSLRCEFSRGWSAHSRRAAAREKEKAG